MVGNVPRGFVGETVIRIGSSYGTECLVEDLLGLLEERADVLRQFGFVFIVVLKGFLVLDVLERNDDD
jgi:hypothetical protein